jgi:hypothetical protein
VTRIKLLLLLLIVCAVPPSCEGPVETVESGPQFYTRGTSFLIANADGHSDVIHASFVNNQSDTLYVRLTCWPWDNFQVLRKGKWELYEALWGSNFCDEGTLSVSPDDSLVLGFEFQTRDSVSPGIHRLNLRYSQLMDSSDRVVYSNQFMLHQ